MNLHLITLLSFKNVSKYFADRRVCNSECGPSRRLHVNVLHGNVSSFWYVGCYDGIKSSGRNKLIAEFHVSTFRVLLWRPLTVMTSLGRLERLEGFIMWSVTPVIFVLWRLRVCAIKTHLLRSANNVSLIIWLNVAGKIWHFGKLTDYKWEFYFCQFF